MKQLGKRKSMPALLALAGALCIACAPTGEGVSGDGESAVASPLQLELRGQGQVMAEQLCSRCHAVGRDDASRHSQAPPLRQLSWKYPIESLAEPLAEGIMVGHPDMPEWQFEPKDIDALLAYIESIQQPQET